MWDCWTLIVDKLNTLLNYKNTFIHTCHDVKQEVHIRWPHGSIFTSLSFSAQILHSWNVEPISQYNSYCSWKDRDKKYHEKDNIQNLTYSLPNCALVANLCDLNVVLWGGFTQACEIWVITAPVWKQITTDGEKNSRENEVKRLVLMCSWLCGISISSAVKVGHLPSPSNHSQCLNRCTYSRDQTFRLGQSDERETSRQNLQFFLHFLGWKEFSRIVFCMTKCVN